MINPFDDISFEITFCIALIRSWLLLEFDKLSCAVNVYPLNKAIGFLIIDESCFAISWFKWLFLFE